MNRNDMREFVSSNPEHIVAAVKAANSLACASRSNPGDLADGVCRIMLSRVEAAGWRECRELFQGPYSGRRPRNAHHDARECNRNAKESDKRADEISKALRIPFAFQDRQEAISELIWWAYRDIYIQIKDGRVCWAIAEFADAADCLASHPKLSVENMRGTPEMRAAWQERANSKRTAAKHRHDMALAQLITMSTVGGTYSHWEIDPHMLYLGRVLAEWVRFFGSSCELSAATAIEQR